MNRRDFIVTSAAACLLPVIPSIRDLRPVTIYGFGSGWGDGCDWYVAAHSPEEAIAVYKRDCGGGDENDWCELEEDDLAELTYRDDDGTDRSFLEQFQIFMDEKPNLPCTFCCSGYYL